MRQVVIILIFRWAGVHDNDLQEGSVRGYALMFGSAGGLTVMMVFSGGLAVKIVFSRRTEVHPDNCIL